MRKTVFAARRGNLCRQEMADYGASFAMQEDGMSNGKATITLEQIREIERRLAEYECNCGMPGPADCVGCGVYLSALSKKQRHSKDCWWEVLIREAESSVPLEEEADIWWDSENPEECYEDNPHEHMHYAEVGRVVEFDRAKKLPSCFAVKLKGTGPGYEKENYHVRYCASKEEAEQAVEEE